MRQEAQVPQSFFLRAGLPHLPQNLLWGGRIQARPFLLPGGIPHLQPFLLPDGRIRARPNQTFRHSGPGEAEASLPGNRILPIEPA